MKSETHFTETSKSQTLKPKLRNTSEPRLRQRVLRFCHPSLLSAILPWPWRRNNLTITDPKTLFSGITSHQSFESLLSFCPHGFPSSPKISAHTVLNPSPIESALLIQVNQNSFFPTISMKILVLFNWVFILCGFGTPMSACALHYYIFLLVSWHAVFALYGFDQNFFFFWFSICCRVS